MSAESCVDSSFTTRFRIGSRWLRFHHFDVREENRMKTLILLICSSIVLAGCSDEPSQAESAQMRLAQAVAESQAADGEFFLAVAWSEEGSKTLEAIQDLTMPYMSPKAELKTLRASFTPGTYSNDGGKESGSGSCYFVWKELPETRAKLIGELQSLNSASRKSFVLVATESSDANKP